MTELFGPTHPWPSFYAVDDRVRGGSSLSHWRIASSPPHQAIFSGHLDIETLGGAGFASQSTSFKPPLKLDSKSSRGLKLTLLLSSASLAPSTPSSFVLTLKNEIPKRREDGRRESVLSYEYAFDVRDLEVRSGDEEKGELNEVVVEAHWHAFKATYRGRPMDDKPDVDPTQIHELSFMCRSQFGKQAGDFELNILSLDVLPVVTARTLQAFLYDLWDQIYGWFSSLLGLNKRQGQIRLP